MIKKIIRAILLLAVCVGVMGYVGYRMFYGSAVDADYVVTISTDDSYSE